MRGVVQRSVLGLREHKMLLFFSFLYLFTLLVGIQGDKWQPHLRGTEKFELLSPFLSSH